MAGRTMWAILHLLDRQMLDRDGNCCGNVDDLELSPSEDGETVFVTGIHAGPGALSYRMGRRRLGGWLERVQRQLRAPGGELRPIPFALVTEVKVVVRLDADARELPTEATARWVRDHVIGHIPGADHATE